MSELRESSGRLRQELRVFSSLGVEFTSMLGTDQALGICPFCGKEKFYVNIKTGCWDCKSKDCIGERSGNVISFMAQWSEAQSSETTIQDFQSLE